jgi:LPXTG-site transpeptidase (sortase) family protein
MISNTGVIYYFERSPDGTSICLPIEETPDEVQKAVFEAIEATPVYPDEVPNRSSSDLSSDLTKLTHQVARFDETSTRRADSKPTVAKDEHKFTAIKLPWSPANEAKPVIPLVNKVAPPTPNEFKPQIVVPSVPLVVKTDKPVSQVISNFIPINSTGLISNTAKTDLNQFHTAHDMAALKAKRTAELNLVIPNSNKPKFWSKRLGFALMALSIGGLIGPTIPKARLETSYRISETQNAIANLLYPVKPNPPAIPQIFDPLVSPDGKQIVPVNTDFSIIVPKIGINAPVIANVDPAQPDKYKEALQKGVAHAATSFTPDQKGTVYLFSHSTNYDWFVKDLNAVFYMLKNLDTGDYVVLYYKGVRYTYVLKEKRVVSPSKISYLVPEAGQKKLILQTCWPPGSTAERLLLFADLVEEQGAQI